MDALSQETWRSLFDNAPDIVLIVERDGAIRYINRTVPGLEPEEVIGSNQYDYIEPEYRATVKETIEGVFRTGVPATYEIRGVGPDGRTSWYSTSVGPIKSDGEIVAVSLFTSDVTERKNALEALQKAKDELIEQQSAALRELSTPVIQVWDDILILPLVGPVDTGRARLIVESLLDAIVSRMATVVIFDITGVPVVDTQVANHFMKTFDAARMLGADVILTGVSPSNAQTLVKLGAALEGAAVKGTLHSGLRLALEKTQRRVVDEPPV